MTNPSRPSERAASRDPYQPYRSTLLTPAQTKELSELRPGIVVRDIALAWLTILAAWTLAAAYTTWWTVALAMVVVSFGGAHLYDTLRARRGLAVRAAPG